MGNLTFAMWLKYPQLPYVFVVEKLSQHNFMVHGLALTSTSCLSLDQIVTMFHVTVQDDNNIVVSLEASDIVSPTSVYVVRVAGESKNYFFEFEEFNNTLPPPVVFKATYHGLYYIITLVVVNGNVVTKPSRSITVLTSKYPVMSFSVLLWVCPHESMAETESTRMARLFSVRSNDSPTLSLILRK